MNQLKQTEDSAIIFWIYYAQGLLYAELQQNEEAVDSFDSALDFKQYYSVLCEDSNALQEEQKKHTAIANRVHKNLIKNIANFNEIDSKRAAGEVLVKYQQIINMFSDSLDNKLDMQLLSLANLGAMFDILFTDNQSKDCRLQCAHAHYNKALSILSLKEHAKALTSLDMTNKLAPDFYMAYVTKANIYKEQKKYEQAVAQYDKAIAIEYDNAELYFNRSVVLFEQGKTAEAKNDFAKYQELQSDDVTLKVYDEPKI